MSKSFKNYLDCSKIEEKGSGGQVKLQINQMFFLNGSYHYYNAQIWRVYAFTRICCTSRIISIYVIYAENFVSRILLYGKFLLFVTLGPSASDARCNGALDVVAVSRIATRGVTQA